MATAGPLIARAAEATPPEPDIDADALATSTLHTAAVAVGAGDDPVPTLAADPRLDSWSFAPGT